MPFKPPDDLKANATSDISAAKSQSGDPTEGTTVDNVFYPELAFNYEERVDYHPSWELIKEVKPYQDDTFKTISTTEAAIPIGHTFTELDRKATGDKLFLRLTHPQSQTAVWIQAGALTSSHKRVKDDKTRKKFTNAKVTSNSWHAQKGYRGKVTLTYLDDATSEEKTKDYNFITIDYIWKYVSSGNNIGYRWYGRMTRAPEGTYAGYIQPRNSYVKKDKDSVDKKYKGAEASRSVWVIWHYRGSQWTQNAPRGPDSTSYTSNVFIHPASRFYHLEGCLAPCKSETKKTDDGFASFTDSEATMDDIFKLAHGDGTTCVEPAKAKDVKWFRIKITDLSESESVTPAAPATQTVRPQRRVSTGAPHPYGDTVPTL